jgi:hypothetical protein
MNTTKAALSQPLSVRPDYGKKEQAMSELMVQAEEDIKNKKTTKGEKKAGLQDAAMFKMIPPMEDYDAPCQQETVEPPCVADYDEGPQPVGPKIIVVEDYDSDDDDDPKLVKSGPPCCPSCGQDIPTQMGREAHCMDSSFKKIRDTLRHSDLKESQLKVIYSNLDKIQKKYRALEEDTE